MITHQMKHATVQKSLYVFFSQMVIHFMGTNHCPFIADPWFNYMVYWQDCVFSGFDSHFSYCELKQVGIGGRPKKQIIA